MKRIDYFDVMKGIAIIAVMVGHYLSIRMLGVVIWSFHMPLFIFISGYFFKKRRVKDLAIRNYKRYLVPYILVWGGILVAEIVIYCVYNFISSNGMPIIDVATRRIISGIYALASNSTVNKPDFVIKIGVIWFLLALYFGELFLNNIINIRKTTWQIITVLTILILASYQTATICIPFGINYGCAFLMWLYLGWHFRQKNLFNIIDSKAILKLIIPILWVAIIFIEYISDNAFNIIYLRYPLFGLELVGALCGILCVRWVCIDIDKKAIILSNYLGKLGRNTIWILCIHAFDIEIWNYVSSFIPLERTIMGIIRIIMDIVIAYCVKCLWIYIRNYRIARGNLLS